MENTFLAVTKNDPILFESIQTALTAGALTGGALSGGKTAPAQLKQIGSVVMALARIAGGGVDGVVFDISSNGIAGGDPGNACQLLKAGLGGGPILILCDASDEAVAVEAVKAGATGYAVKDRPDDLARLAAAILTRRPMQPDHVRARESSASRKQVAILGAKGGVGTTTVSLNLAAALAQTCGVILTEMHSGIGTLGQYFSVNCATRNFIDLVQDHALTAASVQLCLWRCPTVTRLKILFASTEYSDRGITPELAAETCTALSGLADYVFVDLPNVFSAANRAVIETSDLVLVVVDREPVCIAVAKQMIKGIQSKTSAPEVGIVIVNRTAIVSPVSIPEIEAELGVLCLGVFPSEPDLCSRAQKRRMPLVAFDPESMLGDSIICMAKRLFPATAPPPPYTGARTNFSLADET